MGALYETGLLGMFGILVIWSGTLMLARLAGAGPRLELVAAHVSFFLLNMATMPMWLIEGMIFYWIAVRLHHLLVRPVARAAASGRVVRGPGRDGARAALTAQIAIRRLGSTRRSTAPIAM
ncbi:hypothetical protein AB5I41_17415 [Sphingomonas sp. MMS24-JH45]